MDLEQEQFINFKILKKKFFSLEYTNLDARRLKIWSIKNIILVVFLFFLDWLKKYENNCLNVDFDSTNIFYKNYASAEKLNYLLSFLPNISFLYKAFVLI